MIIQHAALIDNWNNIELINNSKTIVLGSFNPNQPNNNTDFYYGRCSNYFWSTIAILEGRNQNFYFNKHAIWRACEQKSDLGDGKYGNEDGYDEKNGA